MYLVNSLQVFVGSKAFTATASLGPQRSPATLQEVDMRWTPADALPVCKGPICTASVAEVFDNTLAKRHSSLTLAGRHSPGGQGLGEVFLGLQQENGMLRGRWAPECTSILGCSGLGCEHQFQQKWETQCWKGQDLLSLPYRYSSRNDTRGWAHFAGRRCSLTHWCTCCPRWCMRLCHS